MKVTFAACAIGAGAALAIPAAAQDVTLDPIIDARLRYEHVAQDNSLEDAAVLTLRLRAGGEAKLGDFSLLAEGEATVAMDEGYSAFPFPQAEAQRRPGFSVIPDPENIEINRLQIGWTRSDANVTLGRQRINLGDQRWVGSVGWRQNEQTFDAVRGTAKLGPVAIDASYAISQRTIFGRDAGPRQGYDGEFVFTNAGVALGGITVTGFAYLLAYDETGPVSALSSQTYGLAGHGSVSLGDAELKASASYARQSNWRSAEADYAADYILAEGNVATGSLEITAGWERLDSDNGFALQTPMATLHKFHGFADVFLTTPAAGLEDAYIGISSVLPLPGGIRAGVTYHQFDSAVGNLEYGTEWDISLGGRIGPVALGAKYAHYRAAGFGVDTRKLWLQAEVSF